MASRVNPVVPQTAPSDSTKRLASTSRLGVFSVIGGAALALGAGVASRYGFISIPEAVNQAAAFLTNDVLSKVSSYIGTNTVTGEALTVGAALLTGSLIGGSLGKGTAHKVSLNDVKEGLGVANSELNFAQIQRVANISINGGIFQSRSTSVEYKDDADRIRNLNRELSNTEYSLSSNAHNTSKARGAEDRFFDFEGGRLSTVARSSEEFVEALASVKSTVYAEVKATDKYTYQQGNSSTSIDRREYILAGIMGHAYDRGIAGNYLAAAVKERKEMAETNPKQAEANFKQALRDGVEAGILAPNVDAKCYDGMVSAAAVASMASAGKNPDSVISSIFDSLKDIGLVDSKHRARFVKDVRNKLTNPNVLFADPVRGRQPGSSNGSSLIDKLFGKASSNQDSQIWSSLAGEEDGFNSPVSETNSQRKARSKAEARDQAATQVNLYADTLGSLDPRQKELADRYEKLIRLLNEKAIPLDQVENMDKSKLKGALAMTHKHGFDLFEKYEANDAAIAQTREEIAVLTNEIDEARSPRPANFKLASKEQRNAATALEKQVKAEDAKIAALKVKAGAASAKIDAAEGTLEASEGKASEYLYPDKEPGFDEPALPENPGFFARIFGSSAKKADESVSVEEGADTSLDLNSDLGLDEPDSLGIDDDKLPEPVVVVEKKWKLWG